MHPKFISIMSTKFLSNRNGYNKTKNARARRRENFTTTNNIDPLYYTKITNKVPIQNLKDKYHSLFASNYDLNAMLDDTTKKKAICARKLEQSEINVRIPQPESYIPTGNMEKSINYYNKNINTINNFITDESLKSMSNEDCQRFTALYCENVKMDLRNAHGKDLTQKEFLSYAPECACYGVTYRELSEASGIDTDNKYIEALLNQPRHCQLEGCDRYKAWNPDSNRGECSTVTLCNNTVQIASNDIQDSASVLAKINQSNDCGLTSKSEDQIEQERIKQIELVEKAKKESEEYKKKKEESKEKDMDEDDVPDISDKDDKPDIDSKDDIPDFDDKSDKDDKPDIDSKDDIPDFDDKSDKDDKLDDEDDKLDDEDDKLDDEDDIPDVDNKTKSIDEGLINRLISYLSDNIFISIGLVSLSISCIILLLIIVFIFLK